jgi:parallel beta-helix repeat protein
MVRTSTPHRRPIRHAMAAAAVVAIGGLLTLASRPALASTLSCGTTITANTTLHADLTNCAGDGLVIGADHITLDLHGHTIDGDAIPSASDPNAGIRLAGHHGVTLTGGTVQEFDTGVLLDAAPSNRLRRLTVLRSAPGRGILLENHSDGNDIEGNTSASNTRGAIVMVESDYNHIRGNTVRDNPAGEIAGHTTAHNRIERNFAGVSVDEGSNDNVIAANTATGSGEVGIFAQGDRNLLIGNRVAHKSNDIIFSGDHNSIVGNVLTDPVACEEDPSCGLGISAEGGAENLIAGNVVARTITEAIRLNAYPGDDGTQPAIGTIIRGNLIRDAGTDGIAIATDPNSGGPTVVTGTQLQNNVVSHSGHDGINIASPSTTATHNLAVHNGNLGIEAVPGVTDGGGNHAFANGNPLQCTNIAC